MDFSVGAFVVALVITMTEMTEVVALVFALAAEHTSVRSGALGAVAGSATVAAVAFGFGALILRFPPDLLLIAAAIVLFAFGLFLFRSTVRSYRKARLSAERPAGAAPPTPSAHAVQFAGGFSIGAVEMLEAVIVLLALAAGGEGLSAVIGAVVAIAVLVIVAVLLHERVRRIKTPQLKLAATCMLFTFAVFWGGEAAGVAWPGADLFLIPLFVLAFLIIRPLVHWRSAGPVPLQLKG